MADHSQFEVDRVPPGELDCTAVERWLTEWAEDAEPAGMHAPLEAHASRCAGCREKLERTRHGLGWMRLLRQVPVEPPADLVARILARTSQEEIGNPLATGKQAPGRTRDFYAGIDKLSATPGVSLTAANPVGQPGMVVLRRRNAWRQALQAPRVLMESRVAMVMAMAFFSISLTLNLAGVRLTGLRPADLTPHSLRHAITQGVAETDARVVRYYENLRIVYEVEARVEQLRRAADSNPATEPAGQPETKPKKQAGAPRSDAETAEPRMDAGLNENRLESWPAVLPRRAGNILLAACALPTRERGLA